MQKVIEQHERLIDSMVQKVWSFFERDDRKASARQLAVSIPYLLGVYCGESNIPIDEVPIAELVKHKFWVEAGEFKLAAISEKGFRLNMKDGYNKLRSKMPIPFANPFGERSQDSAKWSREE